MEEDESPNAVLQKFVCIQPWCSKKCVPEWKTRVHFVTQ